MSESVYGALVKIGYTHPLHPALTHLPVGLVMGAFIFALIAWMLKKDFLARTSRHCLLLALIAVPPTAALGYMDWQHFYGGAWLLPIIMKMILVLLLAAALCAAIVVSLKADRASFKAVIICGLCLMTVITIGFFGGELVFGGKAAGTPSNDEGVNAGSIVFQQNCAACHYADKIENKVGPGLKGLYGLPKLPFSGLPVTDANIRRQLKTPAQNMPPFDHLAEEKVQDLIAYLKSL